MSQSGFATQEFLDFSSKNFPVYDSRGVLPNLLGLAGTPYFIIKLKRLGADRSFFVTPICLSGSDSFQLRSAFESNFFLGSSIAGGFIQTRDTSIFPTDIISVGEYLALCESRTNYRLSLNLDDSVYLRMLHRDSRYRVRQVIREIEDFELVRCNTQHENIQFSELYKATAVRSGFSSSYQFQSTEWESLFRSHLWRLYLLYFRGRVCAGGAICRVSTGFDLSFLAHNGDYPNAPRALLYLLRKDLYSVNESFLDIGGGIKEGDSLSRFKLSMGFQQVSFMRVKFIKRGLVKSPHDVHQLLSGRWP
jgi:hypothetical protein